MPDVKSTRVAIASDQAIFLRGLESLLLSVPGILLVGEAHSAMEAIQLCNMTHPEILILDTVNNREQGKAIAQQISQLCPGIKIVLMIGQGEETRIGNTGSLVSIYTFSRAISEEEFKTVLGKICHSVRLEQPGNILYGSQAALGTETSSEGTGSVTTKRPIPQRTRETITRELTMAGRIQSSILPELIPSIPGWDISARLEPARETSGDFYDFLPLTDSKWGVVIADVTDKGIGAALFMVLSSTLIRTFTNRFPTLPALALNAVSSRILSDTGGSMFVTALYGILEPFTGRFIFANAGHPPGYLITNQRGKVSFERLRATGMALGVVEQAQWKQKVVKMSPGDILILYTDGVIEAENPDGEFFGEDRLLDVALSKTHLPAREIQDSLLDAVHYFVGKTPQQDDIALIVIRRDK